MKERRRDRLDLKLAVLATVLAAGLRFWGITGLGLTHFDEGAYASTGRWVATWGAEGWPFQAGQSPGLFPTVLGVVFHWFGVVDWVAIAVSAVAGSLTVGVVFWIGRNWFGRTAGLASALLTATCQYHVIYSRLALTDALFTLLFWLALAPLFQGLETGKRTWLLLGGLVTCLAWNTKYHGFFPLMIAALWLLAETARRRWRPSVGLAPPRLRLRALVPATVLAVVGMLPWIGLVAVTLGWGPTLRGFIDHTSGAGEFPVTPPGTLVFYLLRWVGWPTLLLALLGLIWILLRGDRPGLFLWLANGAILVGALFYLSFPRLILPAVVGLCLSAGYAISQMARGLSRSQPSWAAAILLIPAMVANLRDCLPTLAVPTDCYRKAALFLEAEPSLALTQMSKNFYFYGRLPFLEMRFETLSHLDELDRTNPQLVIAFDPIIGRFPALRKWVDERTNRLTLIREIPIEIYEPLYYQGVDPRAPRGSPGSERSFPKGSVIQIYLLGKARPQ